MEPLDLYNSIIYLYTHIVIYKNYGTSSIDLSCVSFYYNIYYVHQCPPLPDPIEKPTWEISQPSCTPGQWGSYNTSVVAVDVLPKLVMAKKPWWSTDDMCATCPWCFIRIVIWPKLDRFPWDSPQKKLVGCDLGNQHLQPRHIGAIPSTAFTYTALIDVGDLQVCRESLQPLQRLQECDRSFLW